MAYGVTVAAVNPLALERYSAGSNAPLPMSAACIVSHYGIGPNHRLHAEQLRYWAVDGGALVREDLRHPLRAPVFHDASTVTEIARALEELLRSDHGLDEWTLREMKLLNDLFSHAARHGEAVVTMLEPPFDEERAAQTDLVPLEPTA